jgi:hypothetical protein
MKHLSEILTTFCLFGFITTIQAQTSIPAAGGNITGPGIGSLSYAIGQVVYTTISGSGTATQGIQQPFEISVISGREDVSGILLESSVYPNPTDGFVTLKVENYETDNLVYMLYDINGMLLIRKKVVGNETTIQLGTLRPGTFILKIAENNKELKSFKIIKK